MSNYYIYIIEQSIKTFSVIGHGQECQFEFTEKGQNPASEILSDGDKIIGFISNDENRFAYVFDVKKDEEGVLHIVKNFEILSGPSIDEVSDEIKTSILSKEQSKSLVSINEIQFEKIVSQMTKQAAKNVCDVTDLYKINVTDYIQVNYTVEELGKILREMYDKADVKTAAIHMFGLKYAKYMIENNISNQQVAEAAGFGETKYDTEINKARNIYKCLVSNTYGMSILDEKGNVARVEPQGVRKTGAENILLYGVPGAGKSHHIKKHYCSNKKFIERVVFHPDYTYSDFVGQILPRVEGEKLKYVFTPGPFTKILKSAYEDPENYYYLIIEEINRGNAPAIFGEIFQLLDRRTEEDDDKTKIGESEYGITNFDVAREVYGDENREVLIPSNLWILSTMNTADQNVFTLDTAFQRRWTMKHIENNVLKADHADKEIGGTGINWGAFATVINDMVVDMSVDVSSSEDKRLGAYFVGLRELQADRFPEKVLKYLWDDAFKMDREAVFNDQLKSLETVIETYDTAEKSKLKTVLRASVYEKMLLKMEELKIQDKADKTQAE